jgi:HEAT repeat protein
MAGLESLESLLRLARSAQADDREMAARELQRHPVSWPVQSTLLELMSDPDWRVRHAAVESLCSADAAEVVPPVLKALYDESNAGKRNAAMDILKRFGRQILPYLSTHLESSHADVRMFLVTLMGDLQDRTHLQFLTSCLKDPEENLVSAAILALGKIGHPSLTPHLIELLHGDDIWLQFQAIEASGEMQDELLLPHILPLLQSSYCRRATLKALGRFQHPDAYQVLAETIVHNERCDFDALNSLVRLYHAPQPERIRRQDQAAIRKSCGDALKIAEREVLLRTMHDSDRSRRFAIAQVLAWCGNEEGLQQLVEFQNDLEFSDEASRTLQSLGYGETAQAESKSDPEEKQSLIQEIKAEEATVRKRAAKRMAKESRQEYREPLMAALADEDPRVRESAAEALHAYASQEVTEALLSSLRDEDPWTRAAIYASLPVEAAALLMEKLPQEHPVAQASILRSLAKTRNARVFTLLESYLRHENPEIRTAVCESLAAYPANTSIGLLKTLFENDPVWTVRIAALKTLAATPLPQVTSLLRESLHTESDPLVKKEILGALRQVPEGVFSEVVLEFLTEPELADEAHAYLLSRSPHKAEILECAARYRPGLRRIVQKIFD